MQVRFEKHLKELWELAGEIGTKGESNESYARVYAKLSDALDIAEACGLIQYSEEEEETK